MSGSFLTPARAIDCRTVGRVLQGYLDGELNDAGVVDVAEHLEACLECGLEAETYRWLKAAIVGLAAPNDPRQLERLQTFADTLSATGDR